MSWQLVAGKDLRDVWQSTAVWVLIAVFVLFMAFAGWTAASFASYAGPGDPEVVRQLYVMLGLPGTVVTGVAAVVLGYRTVVGEVESGTGKVLLSLPHTRMDVVVGKYVARYVVLATAGLFGIATGLGVVTWLGPLSVDPPQFLGFVLATLLAAASYLGLMVGVSAAARTGQQAVAGTVGIYLAFEFLWKSLPFALSLATTGNVTQSPTPDWIAAIVLAVPPSAYLNVLHRIVIGGSTVLVDVRDPRPFYLEGWFSVVLLVAWTVLPLVVGYLVFQRRDI